MCLAPGKETQETVSGARREPGTALLLSSSAMQPGHLLWAPGLCSFRGVSMAQRMVTALSRPWCWKFRLRASTWDLSRDLILLPKSWELGGTKG